MSIYQDIPYSLSEPGPDGIDGVGNFYIHVFAPRPSRSPVLTLYFLDSHGQLPETLRSGYDYIKDSQVKWVEDSYEANRKAREQDNHENRFHLDMHFQHIPTTEFEEHPRLHIWRGQRREPTEGSSYKSKLYAALTRAGVVVSACGHDHGNDFVASLEEKRKFSLPWLVLLGWLCTSCGVGLLAALSAKKTMFSNAVFSVFLGLGVGTLLVALPISANKTSKARTCTKSWRGPWLCYGGAAGFGGYGVYGGKHFQRRVRVFDCRTDTGAITTWLRVHLEEDRVDELTLVDRGAIFNSPGEDGGCKS